MSCILVIDDEPAVRTVFELVLRQAGYEVLTAASCREGVQHCQARPVDLVVLDMFLPDEDGFDSMRALRTLTPSVRIIAMSGGGRRAELDVLEMAMRVGADQALQKPVLPSALLAAVRELMGETDQVPGGRGQPGPSS